MPRHHITRVESRIPVAARLEGVIAINIVLGNPINKRRRIAQITSIVPLLGCHHEGESGIFVGIRSRTVVSLATNTPIHASVFSATNRIGRPNLIKVLEHFFFVHVYSNQHTVCNSFRNGRAFSFRCIHPAVAGIVPSLLPQFVMFLDHVRIGIFNNRAMRVFHVLRERVLPCITHGCGQENRASCRF